MDKMKYPVPNGFVDLADLQRTVMNLVDILQTQFGINQQFEDRIKILEDQIWRKHPMEEK